MKTYEDVLDEAIGTFGFSQFMIVMSSGLPAIVMAWNMIMFSFIGVEPKWWLEEHYFNDTTNVATVSSTFKKCSITPNSTILFDQSIRTIVSEWNLICDDNWIPTTLATIQMSGVLVGAAVFGQAAAMFGRTKMLLLTLTINCVSAFIEGLSVNWYMMSVCVFFVGVSLGGFLVLFKTSVLEFISTRYRTLVGVLPFWAIGVGTFGILFKMIPHWRHLCFASAGTAVPMIIYMWFFLPESIRWLITKGKTDAAENVIYVLARRNKRPKPDLSNLEESFVNAEINKEKKNYTYLSLFQHSYSRWRVLIFAYFWFCCAFIYYALTLGVGLLVGDIAINMLIMGGSEIFVCALVWAVSKCFGRKRSTMIWFGLTAFPSLGITVAYFAASEGKFQTITTVLALISRMCLSSAWLSCIIFTIETFPTVIRSQAFGFSSVFGRIGGVLAPQIKTLNAISIYAPYTLNGILALIAVGLCLLLQDTSSQQMSDYYAEEKPQCVDMELCELNESSE